MAAAPVGYKHPADVARRRCFECGRHICARCQLKMDHHLFCSRSCHEQHGAKTAVSNSKYKRFAIYSALVLLLGGFLYFALLADAFYSGGDVAEANSGSNQITPSLPVAIEQQEREEILIAQPLNGLRSMTEQIKVEGPAPHNSTVAVYLNGSLIDSTIATEGYYRFPVIRLTKPTNVLQTRFYAANGSSDASPAIMVFHTNYNERRINDSLFFQNSSVNVSRGDSKRKELALTFDGSSEANAAESILTSLDQSKIRGTLFLTHQFIQNFPDLTRRIAAKHEVGTLIEPDTHGSTKSQSQTITKEQLHHQLQQTAFLFESVTGKTLTHLWRSTNAQNPETFLWGAELGYIHIAWTADSRIGQNMDSLDWVANPVRPDYFPAMLIKDRLLSFGQNEPEQANGSIILMHLGSGRRSDDRPDRWLIEMMTTFRQRGYQMITIGELILNKARQSRGLQTVEKGP